MFVIDCSSSEMEAARRGEGVGEREEYSAERVAVCFDKSSSNDMVARRHQEGERFEVDGWEEC